VVEAVEGLSLGEVVFGFPGWCVLAGPSDLVREVAVATAAIQDLLYFPFFFTVYYHW
jgi:hypothetical protein